MRLIFPETKRLGLQFEYKNETIPIRIKLKYDFLKLALQAVTTATGKPNLACFSLPPIFPFNAPDFPQN